MGAIGQSKYVIYVYTESKIFAFETPMTFVSQATVPNADKRILVTPYFAWKNIKGDELNSVDHNFGGIPIVEFPNNADYKGDAECVFDLIRLYNEVANNRCKNLHDVVNYVLFIKNVRLGDEDETKKVVSLLKEHHILPAEGDNVDAKFLTNPLNQDQMETLANSILELIRLVSRVPDLSSVDFSQNASDPIIKIKTKPLLDLCKEKEKKCTEPYMRVLKMVLNWCKNYSKDYSEFDVDLDNVSLEYTHALPSNDTDMANMIAVLSNSGMANPENNLQQLSFIKNVHNYIKGMNKWNENVDKRKAQRNNNGGTNDTNLERQNATPQSRKQQDNLKNYVEGKSEDISDNKVE
jgi:SPP1 family phage portal protein